MSDKPKLVVLTPVRNEAWILERFLTVCSAFADVILIADQGSTDGSREICGRFPKVVLFENPSAHYDEAQRQKLLIDKARQVVPGPKIFLAFDADEILAANAMGTLGWQRMLTAAPGTILYFERPELFETPRTCLRFGYLKPFGFVDDESDHEGLVVHSTRVPAPEGAPRLLLNELKVMHYNFVRMNANRSKIRRYCMIESLRGTMRWAARIVLYRGIRDWSAIGKLESTPPEWMEGWLKQGIDMHSIDDAQYYDHDVQVLRLFAEHGVSRFFLDDLWDMDWERCRQWARSAGLEGVPETPISGQPAHCRLLLRMAQALAIPLHRLMVRYKGIE